MPNLYALYGMIPVPQLTRADDPAYLSTWPDGVNQEPSSAWHDNFAAAVTALNLPVKAIHVDHEEWSIATQADRLVTATRFANFAQAFKSRMPGWRIGFYGYSIISSIATTPTMLPGKAAFTTFQSKNEDMAAMYPYVDYFCPSSYWSYTRVNDPTYTRDYQVKVYWITHLLEQRRMAKLYGSNQPIYPYVWERAASLSIPLELDILEAMYRINYQYSDGLTIWGGFFALNGTQTQQTWAQDTASTAQGLWWNNCIGPMLTAGRFWGPR
jgi:hypothetical protein